MKFIKLFEAFESTLLSKTLNYVKGESKSKFLDGVKSICDKYDFPENKLNDSFFEYLPYSKALNYRVVKGVKGSQVDCKAKSVDVFGDKGIVDGECRAGKLPKKWGTGSRRVECPTCKGTGKIGEPDGSDKLLPQDVFKFWFDETGKYVSTTYNYIKDEESINKNKEVFIQKYWCYNGDILDDYEFIRYNNVTHLTPCTMYFDRREWADKRGTPGFLWQGRHFIHNNANKDGSTPDDREWKNYGQKSWSVGGGDGYMLLFGDVENQNSQMIINFEKSRTTGKTNLREERVGEDRFKKTLAEAKFAIVLDVTKLQSTEFTKKSTTIKDRTEFKKDVIGGEFGIKDADIKKQNMDRYISKLSDVSGDKLDISNFDTYFFRILGFKNILFKIINSGNDPRYRISKNLEDILNMNIKLVKAINKAKAKRGEYVEPKDEVSLLSNSLKSYFKREMDVNRKNIDNLKQVESRCDEKHLVLLRSVEEISNVIYQKLKSLGKLESVDDAEILVEKIKTIENLIWNKRYEWSNFRINSISAIPGVPLATKSPEEIRRICNALKNVIEKV
jgi:hypothetical protein